MLLSPSRVHSQNHLCPVLRFGSTGPRLDVEKGVVGVEFTREHAPKLELFDARHEIWIAGAVSAALADSIGESRNPEPSPKFSSIFRALFSPMFR